MEGVNLKTGEVKFSKKSRGGWLGLALSLVIIASIASLHWYLYSVQRTLGAEKSSIKDEIVFQEKMFSQENFWQAYDFESRLQVLGVLLKEKSLPTEFLALLSKNTLAETVFKELKMAFEGGNTVLECVVIVPSYSTLAKQVEAYRLMKDVILVDFESGVVVEQGVESTLKIFLKKPILVETDENVEKNMGAQSEGTGAINFNLEK